MGFDRFDLFQAGLVDVEIILRWFGRRLINHAEYMIEALMQEEISSIVLNIYNQCCWNWDRELIDAGFRKDWVNNKKFSWSYKTIYSRRQLERKNLFFWMFVVWVKYWRKEMKEGREKWDMIWMHYKGCMKRLARGSTILISMSRKIGGPIAGNIAIPDSQISDRRCLHRLHNLSQRLVR